MLVYSGDSMSGKPHKIAIFDFMKNNYGEPNNSNRREIDKEIAELTYQFQKGSPEHWPESHSKASTAQRENQVQKTD